MRRDTVRCKKCKAINSASGLYCMRCGASLRQQGYTTRGTMRIRRYIPRTVFRLLVLVVLAGVLGVFAFVLNDFFKPKPISAMAVGPVNGAVASTSTTAPAGTTDETGTVDTSDTSDTTPDTSATTDTTAGPDITEEGQVSASTSTTEGVISVRPDSARSSFSHPAVHTENFVPTNLLDAEVTTSWVSGNDLKVGKQWLQFTFLKPMKPARIDFANGYQKDATNFRANGRVHGVKIEYSNGRTQTVNLLDTDEYQYIVSIKQPVTWIKITILSVYPGSTKADVALSEVRFYEQAGVTQN